MQLLSLRGLSELILFVLRHARIPIEFDAVADRKTLAIVNDPWLRWWNHPAMTLARTALEISGQRNSIDAFAPKRLVESHARMPDLYVAMPTPNSLSAFRFDCLCFTSPRLKTSAGWAGSRMARTVFAIGRLFSSAVVSLSARARNPVHFQLRCWR